MQGGLIGEICCKSSRYVLRAPWLGVRLGCRRCPTGERCQYDRAGLRSKTSRTSSVAGHAGEAARWERGLLHAAHLDAGPGDDRLGRRKRGGGDPSVMTVA